MSILIKSMEMPKTYPLTVTIYPDGQVLSETCGARDIHGEAVPVPPHGKLIDAEQLKETLDYYIREAGWSDEINKAINWVKDEFINSEPTIIPASKKEE